MTTLERRRQLLERARLTMARFNRTPIEDISGALAGEVDAMLGLLAIELEVEITMAEQYGEPVYRAGRGHDA
ncbi:MAG: hypothetical protein ABII82_20955 [Verrucomicrobiota bacterium]